MLQKVIHILLIEDNPGDAFYIKSLLGKSTDPRYQLATVGLLSDAQVCLDSNQFDICLLDLNLPDSQGLNNLLSLQKKYPELPIVVLTSLDDEDLATQALQIGAQEYLVKDQVNPSWLKRTILHSIERAQLIDKLQSRERQLQQLNLLLRDRIKRRTSAMQEMHEQVQVLKTSSSIDSLTQITNRAGFDKQLEKDWLRSVSDQMPLSLLMIDIDYFKQFNDTYGHQEGDRCLRKVAQTIKDILHRPRDIVARYGGEEFVVILPDTAVNGSVRVAESILENVRSLAITHATSVVSDRVTISVGSATAMPEDDELPQALIGMADHALYEAKKQGRDRITY